jgi:hypothetical protein
MNDSRRRGSLKATPWPRSARGAWMQRRVHPGLDICVCRIRWSPDVAVAELLPPLNIADATLVTIGGFAVLSLAAISRP